MSLTLELDNDAALVLFELLASRPDIYEVLALEAPESHALTLLEGALEKRLTEPFKADYKLLLEAARRSLIERYGPEP